MNHERQCVQVYFVEISVIMGSGVCSKNELEITHDLQLPSHPLAWHMLCDNGLDMSQDHGLCQETHSPEAVKLIARGNQEDVS